MPNVFSLGGITFVGCKSVEEAREQLPHMLLEMELSGYNTSELEKSLEGAEPEWIRREPEGAERARGIREGRKE